MSTLPAPVPSRPPTFRARLGSRGALALALVLVAAARPAAATVVSGEVTDPDGAPIADVDLDFIDVTTGDVVPTTNDDTDLFGLYAVDVPEGTYEVQFEPAPGLRWVAVELPSVVVAGAAQTLDQVLQPGFEVRARVVTEDLTPLPDARLDVEDPVTGANVFSNLDRADAAGVVAPIVEAGTWRLEFRPPPPRDDLLPLEMAGLLVEADTDLGDVVLERALQLSGRVVGSDGPALEGASVDLVEAGGAVLDSTLTAPDGTFAFATGPGTYRLDVMPPPGSPHAATSVEDVVLDADLALGDVVLERSWDLAGRVVGSDGPALPDALVELVDPDTGALLSSTRTDAAGAYVVAAGSGTWRLDVAPSFLSPYEPRSVHGLLLEADRVIPDVVLDRAAVLGGFVEDETGAAVLGADVDVDRAFAGERLDTPLDDTDATGRWEVVVPLGTYDVSFDPPVGSGLVGAELEEVVVEGDLELGVVVLRSGFALSGRVLEPGGAPAPDVDVDVRDPATGDALELDGDRTDATGSFVVRVPPGTWDVVFEPPALSGWGRAARPATDVAADLDLGDVSLPGAVTPTVLSVEPSEGPEEGGTLVTVRGSGFTEGVRVEVGSRRLRGVTVLDSSTLEGTTRAHHRSLVDVVVENLGAAPVTRSDGFRYVAGGGGPVLRLGRDGPLRNDILLEWSGGGPDWAVFSDVSPAALGPDSLLEVTGRARLRDEGAVLRPGLLVYVVH